MKTIEGTATRVNGVNINTTKIHVDSKTANEASQALAKSDKKIQEKKVDIASNESIFLTWFMLLLQKLLETSKTVHGQCMEMKPYMILFDALKKQGYSLARFGAKSNSLRVDFPLHVEGKTKLVKDGVIYNAIKSSVDFKVFTADRKRYLHYVNNRFYAFHVDKQETLSISEEKTTLKKIEAIALVEKEKEKQVASATKKESEKKEETKK